MALGLALVLALFLVLNDLSLDPAFRARLSLAGNALIPLIPVWLCFGRIPRKRYGNAWRVPWMLGFASIACSEASILFALERAKEPHGNSAGWSDVAYGLSYLFVLAALSMWPTRPVPKAALPKIVTTALMLVLGIAAFSWYFLLGPSLGNAGRTGLSLVTTLLYPTGELLMVCLLVIAVWRGVPTPIRGPTILACLGVLLISLAGTNFNAHTVSHAFIGRTSSFEVAWPLGCLFLNLSGAWLKPILETWLPSSLSPEAPWDKPGLRRWLQAAPTLFIPLSGALVFYAMQKGTPPFVMTGLLATIYLLMATIIVDQLLSTWEKGKLYDDLSSAYVDLGKSRAELQEKYTLLEEVNERLERMALVDGLTGLRNHRAFFEELNAWHEAGQPFTMLLFDLDFFKQYNDEFGHPSGDQMLRNVASIVRQTIPVGSVAARFGGDEFAVLVQERSQEDCASVADLIRATVSGSPTDHRPVTISAGWAHWVPGMPLEELIELVDRALYAAKSAGKNSVFGGTIEQPGQDLLAEHVTGSLVTEPLLVGRLVVDALRCDPAAVVQEPSAPLVAGLLNTLELRDPDTRMHSERVMWFALYFAEMLIRSGAPLTRDDVRSLAYGALLHDIGKITIPTSVLRAARKLTDEEYAMLRNHPVAGSGMIQRFPDLALSSDVVLYHHERWDGRGYPHGLAGDATPLCARIFALIDAVDAMGSNRPYSPALSWDAILAEVASQKGKHFDPWLVDQFLMIPKDRWDALRKTQYRVVAPMTTRA